MARIDAVQRILQRHGRKSKIQTKPRIVVVASSYKLYGKMVQLGILNIQIFKIARIASISHIISLFRHYNTAHDKKPLRHTAFIYRFLVLRQRHCR